MISGTIVMGPAQAGRQERQLRRRGRKIVELHAGITILATGLSTAQLMSSLPNVLTPEQRVELARLVFYHGPNEASLVRPSAATRCQGAHRGSV